MSASAAGQAALDRQLGALYRERVLDGAERGASAALARLLAEDGMREAAAARLAALKEIAPERCFVSARYRQFLEAALAAAEAGSL